MANIINPYKEKYDKAKAGLLQVKWMEAWDAKTKALWDIKANQKNFLDLNKNYDDWNKQNTTPIEPKKEITTPTQPKWTINQPITPTAVKWKNWTEQNQNTPQKWTVTNPELSKTDEYNKSKERMWDIYSNLNKFYEQDKNILNNEKAFMDDYWVYRPDWSLKSQSEIDAVKGWFWNKTLERKVMWATNQDIIDWIKTWEFSNDDLEKLRDIDPEKYTAIKNQQEITQQQQKFNDELNWPDKTKADTPTNTTPQLINAQSQAETETNLFTPTWTPEYVTAYNNAINSDTIKANQSKLNEVNAKIEDINQQINNATSNAEKEFPWLPRWTINAIVADRTEWLRQEQNRLSTQSNKYSADINSEVSIADKIYKAAGKEEERQRKDRAEKIDFYKWKNNKEDYAKQREVDYQNFIKKDKYTEWDINSKDPDMRKKGITKAVQWILKEYSWIPFQRSEQEIIAGVEKEMAEWKTASQALNSVMNWVRNNPQYETFVNKRLGIEEPELIMSLWGNAFIFEDIDQFNMLMVEAQT